MQQGPQISNLKSNMLIVPIKEGEPIEKAVKKFKKKFEKTGVLKELRERQKFTKHSVERRQEILHAVYLEKLREEGEIV